ncbi:unnamed protein product [Litomosoides sigmodontis]|uniref:8-oxoguanine DNA glycosylase N-terminal domain-containing protein n=1 Tax=Litomosoides sigmodontis TaxID=42156 RepID=A0A3P6TBS3_LITSI|nr:unnamed protein product [Litomosoides sigmodontis]
MPLLKCSKEELNLGAVLLSGQSFRWKKIVKSDGENIAPSTNDLFYGVAKHRVWKVWRENDEQIGYEVLAKFSKACGDDLDILKDYFQASWIGGPTASFAIAFIYTFSLSLPPFYSTALNIKLVPLYKYWTENDKYFAHLLENYRRKVEGIRILGQDPLETVFAFICSANNHIRHMVETLCELYGESANVLCSNGIMTTFYDFADPKRMTDDPMLETVLRDRGFGYRALNIALASKALVADCICLMGLRMHSVVPLDTHTLQITAENYLKIMPQRIQGKDRQQIAAIWQEKFGPFAGWAQAVLFAAHLRQMNIRRPVKKTLSKIKAVKP